MGALIDVMREPVLLLDAEYRVIAANELFYKTFQLERKDTEGELIYEVAGGQWEIPALHKLLEEILPINNFFKGFEISHEFPAIGRKVFMTNARNIQSAEHENTSCITVVAFEDVTEIMVVAESLAAHTRLLENKISEQVLSLIKRVVALEEKLKTHHKKA